MENINKRKSSSSAPEPVTNKKPKLVDVNREKSSAEMSTGHVKKVGKPPILPTKKAKQEAIDAKRANVSSQAAAQRRAKRQEKYDPQQELQRLRQKGRELAPRVAPVLIYETRDRLEAEATRQRAIASTQSFTTLADVQNIAHCWIKSHSQIVIPTNSPAWQDVPLDLAVALVQYSLSGHFDPKPFVANGTLELCTGDMEEESKNCQFYLRFVPMNGRQAMANAVTKAWSLHPQEAPNSLTKLTMLGYGPESFWKVIENAWSPLGLETVATKLCDIIAEAPDVTVLHDSMPSSHPEPNCLLYAGMTTQDPAQRVVNDLKGGVPYRFTNSCNANDISSSNVKTYKVVDLAVPITSSLDTRVDRNLGDRERILIALMGSMSLNSAFGGVKPLYAPSPELLAIHHDVLSRLPSPPYPLGQEQVPDKQKAVQSLFDDEIQYLQSIFPDDIASDKHINYVKEFWLGALRHNYGRVVALNVMKDITSEGFYGRINGYFDELTGISPMEHRYFQALIDTLIPLTGDLSVEILAELHGVFLDFWKFLIRPCRRFYRLHVLFLTRILDIIRPILVVTQSNPVAKTFQSGILAQDREALFQGNIQFQNGTTTEEFVQSLPHLAPKIFTDEEYFQIVGVPRILPIGPGARLCIHLPLLHYGLLKYGPQCYESLSIVCYLSELVVYGFKRIVAQQLEKVPMLEMDWDDETKTRHWLEATLIEADKYLSNVYKRLKAAKEDARALVFTNNFLSSLATSYQQLQLQVEENSARWGMGPITRRSGLITARFGEPRAEQAYCLVKLAERLKSYGLWHDPHNVEPFGMEIGSEEWYEWFMGLKEGIQIIYSANANGKTAEAAAASQKSRDDIALYRPNIASKEDEAAKRLRHLQNAVTFACTLSTDLPTRKLEECSRFGICDGNSCHAVLAADTNYASHECSGSSRRIDLKLCSKLERTLYVHDLEELWVKMELQANDVDDSLVQYTVGQVFALEGQDDALREALPQNADFNAIMWGSVAYADKVVYTNQMMTSPLRLLTLAVDRILHSQSRSSESKTPPHFEPLKFSRRAWDSDNSKKLEGWLTERKPNLFFGSCRGKDRDKPQWTYCVIKATKANYGARMGKLKTAGQKCEHCKSASCKSSEIMEAESLFFMPHHFSRAAWYLRALKLGWLK